MVKRLLLIAVVLMTYLGVQPGAAAEPIDPDQVVPGEWLIKWESGASKADRADVVRSLGGELIAEAPEINIGAVRFDNQAQSQEQANEVRQQIARSPHVEFVQPNYVYTIQNDVQGADGDRIWLPLVVNPAPFPNDPSLSRQYAITRINARGAWNTTRGNRATTIAIIDSGIDLNHPDLRDKLVPGYDFVQNDTQPIDGNGHGTHVAGIAAASTNNGIGVAGTCPDCSIMPLRVLDDTGNGSSLNVIRALDYAASRGVKIVNMSLGGPRNDPAVELAVNNAWNSGMFLACAAGNSNTSTFSYPAAYTNCFAVASTTSSDARSSFSNYGTWVDIAAPGSAIYSTYPTSRFSSSDGSYSGYEILSGTSMATPIVAGSAGLLASQGLNNAQIRDRLGSTADAISGTGSSWSNGRLNLQRAVQGN